MLVWISIVKWGQELNVYIKITYLDCWVEEWAECEMKWFIFKASLTAKRQTKAAAEYLYFYTSFINKHLYVFGFDLKSPSNNAKTISRAFSEIVSLVSLVLFQFQKAFEHLKVVNWTGMCLIETPWPETRNWICKRAFTAILRSNKPHSAWETNKGNQIDQCSILLKIKCGLMGY